MTPCVDESSLGPARAARQPRLNPPSLAGFCLKLPHHRPQGWIVVRRASPPQPALLAVEGEALENAW